MTVAGRFRWPDLVAGAGDPGEVGALQILHLVDEQRDPDLELGGRLTDVDEQLGQVGLQVAGVGAAAFGLDVDADGEAPVRRRAQREGLEHAQRAFEAVPPLSPAVRRAHRLIQRLRGESAERRVASRFDLRDDPAAALGHPAELVDQHRLADAAEAGEDQAALGEPRPRRSIRTSNARTSSSRPASSGGRCPAPGA